MSDQDKNFIRRCLVLAQRGKGKVSPNPLVGAVVVKDGKIIGEGWHKKYGEPHAEVNAIHAARNTKGAILYCNLEPCSHKNKQTPPCVPLIIKSGIKRVCISNIDPNPEVSGNGIKSLKEVGIEVVVGIEEELGRSINKFYLKYIQTGIPYVTVKIAQSLDGMISIRKGMRTQITSKESMKYVHQLRAEYDVVLIGAGTVKIDDPELSVRLTKGRNPKRIIIDGKLNSPLNSRVFNSDDAENTYIFSSRNSNKMKKKKLAERGVKIFELKEKDGIINLKSVLKVLGKEKISSVLVEGGKNIFSNFIENTLFDDIMLITAPKYFGKGLASVSLNKERKLNVTAMEKLGEDVKITLRKN